MKHPMDAAKQPSALRNWNRSMSRARSILLGLIVLLAVPLMAQQADMAASAGHDHPTSHRIVGYYPQWGVYGDFFIKNLVTSGSAQVLTQVDYAFASLQNNQCVSADTYADYLEPLPADETVDGVADSGVPGKLAGNFHQIQELKKRYPNLKVVISIGGGSQNPVDFSVASEPAYRKAFVKSCVDMFLKGNFGSGLHEPGVFDGFDIDWEYPASEQDKTNFTALLEEFRRQMNAAHKGLILSIASSAGSWAYQYIDLAKVQNSIDFFGLMTYDFDGPWNNTTGFVAPLFQAKLDPDPTNNAAYTVTAYLAAGVAPQNIVFGVPFYGYEWTDVPNVNHGLFQTGTPIGSGSGYNQIQPIEKQFTRYRNRTTQEPWLYDGTNFWTYDDPIALLCKTFYVRSKHLGGVMAWDLSGDMPNGVLLKTVAWDLER
jgi:chitinase